MLTDLFILALFLCILAAFFGIGFAVGLGFDYGKWYVRLLAWLKQPKREDPHA